MNRKLIISSSSSSVLLCYYEERCLGARSERLFLNEKERKDSSRFSPFSFVFFFDESTVKFFHQPRREKRKKKSDVSPFDFSLVDRFDTNNNFNNNNNNNNNKKKKKKKTKEIDNKYTEYS